MGVDVKHTNRLVCSRATEEIIAETWQLCPGLYLFRISRDAWEWLESDEMQDRWCSPMNNSRGMYFEYLEDLVMYKMKWG
jgi:hypothetical protein